ncbi:hypothetical protein ANO14919_047070 [Xylariales sp. No.14919]|nr:hypothetical protein ANO14919_047070 [Xylariales sp. No.14919]
MFPASSNGAALRSEGYPLDTAGDLVLVRVQYRERYMDATGLTVERIANPGVWQHFLASLDEQNACRTQGAARSIGPVGGSLILGFCLGPAFLDNVMQGGEEGPKGP